MPTNVLSSATLGKLFTHMCLCHEVV